MNDATAETPEPKRRGPRSKIASLPARVREELCQRLHDGQRGPEILPWLNSLPEVQRVLDEQWGEQPVDAHNLSAWRTTGFKDWREKRERADEMKILSGYALKMAEAAGTNVSEGAAAVAGGRILELLEAAQGEDLVALAIALAKMRDADAKLLNARVAKEGLAHKSRALEIAEAKFRRETAKLFIEWFEKEEARRIVEGKQSKTVKMDQLVQLMFGDRPRSGGSGSAPPTPEEHEE